MVKRVLLYTIVASLLGAFSSWLLFSRPVVPTAPAPTSAPTPCPLGTLNPPAPAQVCAESAELTELRLQVAQTRAERDRYRAGLEAAVAELNRVQRRATDLAPSTAWPATPPRRYRGRVVPLLDPNLTPLGDRVMVSGKIYNTGEEEAQVTCVLELLRDGQPIENSRFQLQVAPGATQPYSHYFRFPTGGQEATYSARLSIE